MLRDWRAKFAQPLPFTFVQVAPWVGHEAATSDYQLPELRDAQLAALALPSTCVASAVDLGDYDPSNNPWGGVHFRNKAPLGPRLAACVAHTRPDAQGVSPPPLFRAPAAVSAALTWDGTGVRVAFDAEQVPAAGSLLLVPNGTYPAVCPFDPAKDGKDAAKCAAFELQLRDGSSGNSSWVEARAELDGSNGSAITVSALASTPPGAAITGCRYLWADWPTASLFFSEAGLPGLPVLPFHFPQLS